MLALKSARVRNNFKDICNKVTKGDVITVMRPGDNNVVILSEKRYEALEQLERNAQYLSMVNRNLDKIEQGEVEEHNLLED